MSDPRRAYPAALTAIGDPGLHAGLLWLATTSDAAGTQPLIYVPQKWIANKEAPLAAFAQQSAAQVATWSQPPRGWAGGAVLAFRPDRKKLGEIADHSRVRALCVVPAMLDEVAPWAHAVHAELLGDAVMPAPPERPDPVVVQGLIDLTDLVNHGNALTGVADRRFAVAVLGRLYDGGHRFTDDSVYAWAFAHDWPADGADRLAELAAKFATGPRPRLSGGDPLRADILDRWRGAAAGRPV